MSVCECVISSCGPEHSTAGAGRYFDLVDPFMGCGGSAIGAAVVVVVVVEET